MALIFFDGFDSFGTTPGNAPVGLGQKWNETGTHSGDTIIAGRFDGYALRPGFNSTGVNGTVTPTFAQTQTLVAGVAFRVETLPASGQFRDLLVFDSSSGGECGVAVNSSGGLRVFRLQNSNNIEESTAGLVDPNKWYYLEMKVTIANSGSYEVRLDGVNVVDGTGADTQQTNPFADRVRLVGRSTTSGSTVWPNYDDFYVLDTSGAEQNDFLGPRHIVTLFPNAAGDFMQFTPSSGDNYAAVDDNGHDGDSTYVESSTADDKDLYNFGNVGTLSGVTAIQLNAITRKTDISAFDLIPVVKSGTTEVDGAPFLVDSTNYLTAFAIFTQDPDTSSAWNDSGVNAAQFGFKVG